jgi:hypothetical protein
MPKRLLTLLSILVILILCLGIAATASKADPAPTGETGSLTIGNSVESSPTPVIIEDPFGCIQS